jgi:hypothetical protein
VQVIPGARNWASRGRVPHSVRQIGIRYTSRTAFEAAKAAGDVFGGRYYCSYFDKRRG